MNEQNKYKLLRPEMNIIVYQVHLSEPQLEIWTGSLFDLLLGPGSYFSLGYFSLLSFPLQRKSWTIQI